MSDRITITSGMLTAEIAPLGAELQSLRDASGHELMWSGDPAFWRGRAPVLFPVVGRVRDDRYTVDGATHHMPKHGFARLSPFALVEHEEGRAVFGIADTEETRAIYPFSFTFHAAFALSGATLTMTLTVRNTGDGALPASLGFHPAFAWPLPYGAPRAAHCVAFEHDEPATLRKIAPDGLIAPTRRASPVDGRMLALDDALFADDALVWTELTSRRLRYGAAGSAALDIAFPDTSWLGIWTKPGAGYVCIEPWAGIADPEGYDGDFRAKPGVFEIAPGEARSFRMIVTLEAG